MTHDHMTGDDKNIWFPAKTHGWGWGWPRVWQGWAVLAAYALSSAAGLLLFPPRQSNAVFVAYVFFTTMVLIAVCWRKGAKPKWRWGR